ncbi:MAG: hypothetical protein JNL60_17830 [Bacteroidia bacterium]|nr:hypothetical protein [Bacteroidia bacterium]
MKRLLILILPLIFVNCRKKYNCSCSTTITDQSYYNNAYHVSETKPMNRKMTKKEAKAVCDHEADNINDTYTNLFTANGTQSSGGLTVKTTCALK